MNKHYNTFDYFRIVACIGVIYIHSSDTNAVLHSGLPYTSYAVPLFLMMSIFLFATSQTDITRMFLKKKFNRLVLPYVCWSFFYLFLRMAKACMLGGAFPHPSWIPVIFFGEAAAHLWFIPTLIYFQGGALLFILGKQYYPKFTLVLLLLGGVGFLLGYSPLSDLLRQTNFPYNDYWTYHFLRVLPYLFAAILIANFCSNCQLTPSRIGVLIFAVFVYILLIACGIRDYVVIVCCIVLMFFSGVQSQLPTFPLVGKLSALSMGAYYIHEFIIEGLQFFGKRLKWDDSSLPVALSFLVICIVSSFCLTALLQKVPYLRRIV